jgi:MinD superfamily P-loop ATPase
MQMRQLVITSGKGGTGKTTIAACFIALERRAALCDADVDAPNLHLLLHPDLLKEEEFRGARRAVIDRDKCQDCGECEEHCRYGAITNQTIDPFRCEGCGVCVWVCPNEAIKLEDVVTGVTITSRTQYGPFAHARLEIGAEASGKLVSAVRRNAEQLAGGEDLVIIDGSPGIGCAVIASLSGVDLALVVTEPSVSGLHDLERILKVARHFGIEAVVCINKHDLSPELSDLIGGYCSSEHIDLVGRIPFDPQVLEIIRQEKPAEQLLATDAGRAIEAIWQKVRSRLFLTA